MQPHSTRKMATRKPENIHESDRDFAGPLGEINPDIPYPCEQGISGSRKGGFALSLSVFEGRQMKNRQVFSSTQ